MRHTTGERGMGEDPSARRDKRQGKRKHRAAVKRRRIALILTVVGLVAIVLFVVSGGERTPPEPLRRAEFTSATPINKVDPTSGEPIVAGISSVYKGYTIGHCCYPSRGDWEVLSTERKEKFIRDTLD